MMRAKMRPNQSGWPRGGGHPQQRKGGSHADADEEKALVVADREKLTDLDGESAQRHQEGGKDADELTENVIVPGVFGQTERKLGEQTDEAGVILGEGGEDVAQPGQGAGLKSSLGLVLQEGVVAVVPDVDERPAVDLEGGADGQQ